MMNSTNDNNDEFSANPFRSGDVFYDASDAQQASSSLFGQQQQQSLNNPFQTQPSMMTEPTFLPPSGIMNNMNNNMMNAPPPPQQQPSSLQQQPAGLMSPPPPQQQEQPTTWWGNLIMCLSLDSYKMYFDIDADDIVSRIRGVFLHFFKPEHFRNNVVGATKTEALKGPDLYGPFWITMTMIFFLGVSHDSSCNNTTKRIASLTHLSVLLLHTGDGQFLRLCPSHHRRPQDNRCNR
jgi:hypothetical protein